MSQYGNTQEDRLKVLEYEMDLVFGLYEIGAYGRTREDLLDLRLKADDLEEVEIKVSEIILDETDIKEDEVVFEQLVETIIFSYYLMIHFTKMYLEMGDFKGLADKGFEDVWKQVNLDDKVKVIEMALMLEDTMVIVHAMYLLLSQVERKERGIVG